MADFFDKMEKEREAEVTQRELNVAEISHDWQELFLKSEAGFRVLIDMIEGANFFDTNFTGNSKQFYYEGRRSILSDFIDIVIPENDRKNAFLIRAKIEIKRRQKDGR